MTDQTRTPTGTVVPLNTVQAASRGGAIRVTEAYWTALREDGKLPGRSQIDPRGLESVLTDVFILERIAPGMARFRIAGSSLSKAAGMELRGMPISALFRLPARPDLTGALEACFTTPAVVETAIEAHPLRRGALLTGSLILLPMTCDLGHVSRALGALTLDQAPTADAYRFDIGLPKVKPVWGDVQASTPAMAAESVEPFVAPVPHLRLVHSAD